MSYESFQTNRSKSDQANNCSSPLYWCLLVVAYPSTYLPHSSRFCSAPLISLYSSLGLTRSQVVCSLWRSLAVIGGLWRLFAVRLSMMCMRSGVYGLSFALLCWVEGRCQLRTNPSAEVSSTAANRINSCTGLSIILLLPSSTVR